MTRMSASSPPASLYVRKEAHTMFYADAHCDTLYALANIENDGEPRAPETLDITVEKLRQTGICPILRHRAGLPMRPSFRSFAGNRIARFLTYVNNGVRAGNRKPGRPLASRPLRTAFSQYPG